MPKIDPDILKDFGRAVKRARTLKGWDQPTLGSKIDPAVGASFISKVEKGRKEALDARTVGRFRIALSLDESWIDRFLNAEDAAESLETKSERDADRVIDRLRREGKAGDASDDLLIQLANNFTEGDHKDRDTAYRMVEAALERFKASEHIAQLAANADAQFAALMEEVDALNSEGELDLAYDKLIQQAEWLREDRDRLARFSELQLEKELNQDRLRKRPDLAADRIVRNLREFPQGKLFWAVDAKSIEWREKGDKEWREEDDKAGDVFALEVGLALAKGNYDRVKTKEPLAAAALHTLGVCHFRLAERSTSILHLGVARRVLDAAVKKTSKVKEPENWAARKADLDSVLFELGKRQKNKAQTFLDSSPVNFDFDEAKKWLNAVGFDDDLAHLKDATLVQAFLDDIREVKTGLQDFSDFACDISAEGNRTMAVVRITDKILEELNFSRDQTHLRARRLIELGSYLNGFSMEESQRNALGDTLTRMMDDSVEKLQSVCFKHFGPSLEKLRILNELKLEDEDPDEIIESLKNALSVAEAADGSNLARLSPASLALLEQMIIELETVRSSLAEAKSEEQIISLRTKFAKSTGSVISVFGKFVQKSQEHAERPAIWVDTTLKQFKRAKGLKDLWQFLERFFEFGGPPAS